MISAENNLYMPGFYRAQDIQTADLGNTVFLKQASIVCFSAAVAAAVLAAILFFVFDIKKILQIKMRKIKTGKTKTGKTKMGKTETGKTKTGKTKTGKGGKRLIRKMEKNNRGLKSDPGKNALLLLAAVLVLQLVPAGAAITGSMAKAPVMTASQSTGTEKPSIKPSVTAAHGTGRSAGTEETSGSGTTRESVNEEAGDKEAAGREGMHEKAADEVSENEKSSYGETDKEAAKEKSPDGEADKEASKEKSTGVETGKEAANEKSSDGEADKEASNETSSDGERDKEAAKEKSPDGEADKEAAKEKSPDGEAGNAGSKEETADKESAGREGRHEKAAGETAADEKSHDIEADQAAADKKITGRKVANPDTAIDSVKGNGKDSPEIPDTAPPYLNMIEVKARGNSRIRKFPVIGQSGEQTMEGAARDYEVILYAEDDPEEGFSGLRFAEFRLETADGEGKTLEAVVPFGENSIRPEQAGKERSAISTPRTLVSGANPLFPSLQKDGVYILRTVVIDYEGNRSSAVSIRLEIDSTSPKIKVSLPERGKVASWPSYRRSDNCGVDIMILEKNIRSFNIRIGSSLVITQDSVNKQWISKDEQAGTTVLSVPAEEVLKNGDGKIEVSASVLDDASLKTEELDGIDPDMLEVRDQNGKLTAGAFNLDTVPPVIRVGHTAVTGFTGENGEGDSGQAPAEAGTGISNGKEAFLYGDREGGRDLTLYSKNPVETVVTISDRSGGEEIMPDQDLIDAWVYRKLSGEGTYTRHKLANKTEGGSSGKKWQAQYVSGEEKEGSFYFSVKAVDRAGNIAENSSGTHTCEPDDETVSPPGGDQDETGNGSSDESQAGPAGGSADGSAGGSAGGSADGSADGSSGGTGVQENTFFRICKESLAPEGVFDCRKGSAGSGYPALDREVESAFTLVIDRTPPELYLGYESSAVSYLYKGSKAGGQNGGTAGDFPPVDAYLGGAMTAFGQIRSEEHTDPDRVFFVVRKSPGGEAEETARRISFGKGSERAEFKTDGDGRYICALYGTDKAGNAAGVCEQLESDYVKKEETVKIESLMTDGCGNGYSPYFAFYVDTLSPRAEFVYGTDRGQLYLYEERRVAGVHQAGEAAGPSVTAVGNGKIVPTVTFRDRNVLDDGSLELLEFRGETPGDMHCREKRLIHAGEDPDGNELLTASVSVLDGDRGFAFYAVRGTDRAGNSIHISEQFDEDTKVSPERKDVSAEEAVDGGWQVTDYLLEVDQVSPRVSLTFTAGENDNRIYLYREKRKEEIPGVTAYYNGTITPSIIVTERGIIDPGRLEIFEHIVGDDPADATADNSADDSADEAADGTAEHSADDPADATADDPAGKGRKLNFDCAEDPEGREEKNVRQVRDLTVLEADGTTAFYTVRGTDRAGNPVVIERDGLTDPKKASGCGADAGTIRPQASPAEREIDPADPVYRSHLMFVIDRTCPEIALTYRSGTRAYIYADRGENGIRESTDQKRTAQGKEEHFFAFTGDTAEVKAKITNRGEHIDPTRLICSVSDGKGKAREMPGLEGSEGEIIMKAALEGEYEYKVWGTDKAGNAAAVTECFTGPASDRTGTKSSDRKDWKKRTEGCSEDFTPRFTIIIDRTAPRITMEYKNTFLSRRQDTSGINPRAYIYADRGKVLARDGKVEGGLSVYVSGRTDVTLSLEEKYPDPGRLFCSRYCAVPDPSSGRKKEILKKASWKGKGMVFNPASAAGDGEYRFGAYGTDRAGNPAVVTERFAPGMRLERRMVPDGDNRLRTSIRQIRQEKEYRSLFTIVIDTTAPEYRFGINLPDNLEEAFDTSRGREAVYYGRAMAAVRASYTVREQNFDGERILSEISFRGSGGDKTSDSRTSDSRTSDSRTSDSSTSDSSTSDSSTSDSSTSDSRTSRSSTPDSGTSDSRTSQTGKGTAGVRASAQKHTVEGKRNPAGKEETGLNSPAWVTPARRYSGLSARGGKPLALFSMSVEVCGRNEGAYRFEIAGCDKAGNLLVPCALQKKTDASAAVRARAARTMEHGRGKGQYWSDCKVIDVTAPTGILKVFSSGGSPAARKSCCYEFRFDTDANRPVLYEPFRRASGAEVVIVSEDMSPTRICCRLRSADPDKDKSYQGANPLISDYGSAGSGSFDSGGEWIRSNTLNINVRGEQAFYLEDIVIRDRAGNVRINEPGKETTMEKSGRIYLDQTSPQVSRIGDGEAPQIRIVADSRFTRHEADGERYIYRPEGSALDLLVSVIDPGGPARSSGLHEVTLKVTAGDIDITDKVTAEKIPFEWKNAGAAEGRSKDPAGAGGMVYGISDAVIHIPTEDYAQSNDITVRVEAVDNSGNRSAVSRDGGLVRLGIDTVGPRVEVNYRDSVQPRNERFFAGSRTVEIVVIDRNTDGGKIHIRTNIDVPDDFTAPHSNKTEDKKGEKGDRDRWVKKLVYERDGDYTLSIDGTDALGNPVRDISWNGPSPHEFTIDRTPPGISIVLKNTGVRNGKYYNSPQEAEITILENNFRQEDVVMELTAGARGSDPQPAKPDKPSFYPAGEKSGETHKALIRYEEDGYYSIRVNYTDPAGNTAKEAFCSEFVLDRTPPKLLFDQRGPFVLDPDDGHVEEDREPGQSETSVYRGVPETDSGRQEGREPFLTERAPVDDLVYTTGDFRPFVRVEDTYWDREQSFFEAQEAGRGARITSRAENEEENRFFDLCMPEFEIRKKYDGVYYVRACAADLAGNRSQEVNFRFSLNRFGSSFEEGDAGSEKPDLRNSPTRAYIYRYFNRRTDDPVSIREINPVGIREYEILMIKDGFSRKLKEGEDFQRIIEKETEGDFRYRYEIFSRVFAREGGYSFVISSRDRAGNENSTGQVMSEDQDTGRLSVQAFPIAFSVDKTSPVNRITGISPSDERFRGKSLNFSVHPEDGQSGVASVELRFQSEPPAGGRNKNGKDSGRILSYRYMDPGEEEDETHRNLAVYEGEEGIVIPVHLEEKNSWQYLEIVTTDRAGNVSIDYRAEGIYEDGGAMKHLADHRRRFLVSTNPVVHLLVLISPWLVLPAASAVIFLIAVKIRKTRRSALIEADLDNRKAKENKK